MDAQERQARLYVTQYNLLSSNVDTLRQDLYLYGFFAFVVLLTGRIGHSRFWAPLLTGYVAVYLLATTGMRRGMSQVSFFQGALFCGLGAVLRSLYFTCVGLVYVEITGLGFGYDAGVLAAWGICTLLHLWPDWHRVRREKLTPLELDAYGIPVDEPTYEQRRRGSRLLLAVVALFVLGGVVFARCIYPRLGRAGAPVAMVLLMFLLGQVMEVGVTGLLKAYYIKKYRILGDSRPARDERRAPKLSLPQRLWFGFWKWFFIVLVLLIVVGVWMLP